jgi:hypothetical protein
MIASTSISVPKRRRSNQEKCSFKTSAGFPCPNYSKHFYDGQNVCNVHLNYIKANDDCPICISPMDNVYLRIKLSCGHYFHNSCLGKCIDITCPICRHEMTSYERAKIFIPEKVIPAYNKVFNMSSNKQAFIIDFMNTLIDNVNDMDYEEVDVFKAYSANYFQAIHTFKEAANRITNEKPTDMMFDWIDITSAAAYHIRNYGTYSGFNINLNNTMASWTSADPNTNLPRMPPRSNAPSPVFPYISNSYTPAAPSPVQPWYMH